MNNRTDMQLLARVRSALRARSMHGLYVAGSLSMRTGCDATAGELVGRLCCGRRATPSSVAPLGVAPLRVVPSSVEPMRVEPASAMPTSALPTSAIVPLGEGKPSTLLQSSLSRSARIAPERWDVLRGLWAQTCGVEFAAGLVRGCEGRVVCLPLWARRLCSRARCASFSSVTRKYSRHPSSLRVETMSV